jgi:hypothetical protein
LCHPHNRNQMQHSFFLFATFFLLASFLQHLPSGKFTFNLNHLFPFDGVARDSLHNLKNT